MEDYNISFMKSANRYIGFEGKRILEIGCGDGTLTEQIARDYRPEKIIGIDPMLEIWWGKRPEANENWELKKGDVTALEFPDNYFDAVITVATFEHIIDMKKALSEIKRVLKPLGKLYSIFAPIWTSVIGHHHCFWIDEEHVKMIPPWGHLWMTEEQMYEHISINYSEENAKNACYQIYHSDEINRFARKDFYKFFIESGMWIRMLKEQIALSRVHYFGKKESEMSQEIFNKLSSKYSFEDLAVIGFEVMLEKYRDI